MRSDRIVISLMVFLLSCNLFVAAQTPDNVINLFERAIKRSKNGNLDDAIEDYTKVIEVSSRLVEARRGKTRSWNESSSFNSSPEDYGITVVDPLTARAYTNRGILLFKKGDLDDALADLDAAIRINPGLAGAYVARGAVRRAKSDIKAALADFDRAISIDRNLSQAYDQRANLFLDLGDITAALADIKRSLALDPRSDGAIAEFDRAIELNPKMAWAYQGRGTARMAKGDFEPAIVDFSRALELNSKIAVAYMNRGLALLLSGKDVEARKDFDQCLSLKPDLSSELEARIQLAKELREAKPNNQRQ